MQLNDSLSSAHSFFETIGYLRFSKFYSSQNASRGKLVQKVARGIFSAFAVLSLYDLASNALSFKVKIVVRGTLAFVITCLSLSLLLKRFQKVSIQEEELSPLKAIELPPSSKSHPLSSRDLLKRRHLNEVKRNLLSDFLRAENE